MAASVGGAALDPGSLSRLLGVGSAASTLPLVFLHSDASESTEWRATCFLLRSRAGGFMFAAPRVEVLESYLSLWEDEEGGAVSLLSETTLPIKTTSRRALGQHPALLVDVPGQLPAPSAGLLALARTWRLFHSRSKVLPPDRKL